MDRNGKGRSSIYLAAWSERQRPGVSQAELAREAGMARQQWGRYVSGAVEPRGEALRRIADVLGITAGDLFSAPPSRRRAKRRA